MVNQKVKTLRFYAAQSAEDLFRDTESNAVYVRQRCDKEYVRWLTSIRWSGGYEASGPIREGIVIRVVDKCGRILFQENMIQVDGYMDTVAEKVGLFSDEAVTTLAEAVELKYDLVEWETWKSWMMKEAKSYGFHGYSENWLYNANYSDFEKIASSKIMGETVYIVKQSAEHRISGARWTCYEMRSAGMYECLAICGFRLNEW